MWLVGEYLADLGVGYAKGTLRRKVAAIARPCRPPASRSIPVTRLPVTSCAASVGQDPLGRDLRRTEPAPMLQQRAEQDGAVRHLLAERLDLWHGQLRERRDYVEIPVHHGPSSVLDQGSSALAPSLSEPGQTSPGSIATKRSGRTPSRSHASARAVTGARRASSVSWKVPQWTPRA